MSGKRATDHLEPSAKKRGSERQLTKDDESGDEEQEVDPGNFARASEDVLKQRKIVRARRGAAGGGEGEAPKAANPFAGIQLAATTAPPANPFAGVSLFGATATPASTPVKPAGLPAAAEQAPAAAASGGGQAGEPAAENKQPAAGEEKAPEVAGGQQEDGQKPAAASEPPPAAEAKPAAGAAAALPAAAATGGFGSLGGKPSGGLAFGSSGFGSASGGFGSLAGSGTGGAFSFGAASSAATGASSIFSFSAASAPAFSFGAACSSGAAAGGGAAAPAAAASGPSLFGATQATGTPLFGAGAPAAAKVELPGEAAVTTGEEDERTVFSGEGALFEFDASKQWRERGRGEMRVNVASSGQARLVMRQKGNLRLLMNANLWGEMQVSKMEGGKGVTFACVNAAAPPEDAGKKSGEGGEGEDASKAAAAAASEAAAAQPKLATFALRIKAPDVLDQFVAALNAHKAGGGKKSEAEA